VPEAEAEAVAALAAEAIEVLSMRASGGYPGAVGWSERRVEISAARPRDRAARCRGVEDSPQPRDVRQPCRDVPERAWSGREGGHVDRWQAGEVAPPPRNPLRRSMPAAAAFA
jgi:hypothetical protein